MRSLRTKVSSPTAMLLALLLAAAGALAAEVKVELKGSQEVPPVETSASGSGTLQVSENGGVSGSVTTKGLEGIAAHIHRAPPGKNGPPIITLTQTSPGVWSVPADAKLTADQYKAFKAGELYVNVHTAEHKGGELRGQLQP